MLRWLRAGLVCAPLVYSLACGAPPTSVPAAPPAAPAADAAEGIVVDAGLRQRLGLELATLAASSWTPSLEGFGKVLPAQELADLDAELAAARASDAASAAALARAEALYAADQATSLANVEAARRQALLDVAQVERIERRLALTWGTAAPFRDAARRRRFLAELSAGRAALLRLQLPLGATPPADTPRFEVLPLSGEGAGFSTNEAWPAPADPAFPGPCYLALLTGQGLPQPGERLRLRLDGGAPVPGVLVPATAMLVADGKAWVYAAAGDRFLRHPLPLDRPVPGGFFAADGFFAGEQVVVHGAGLLLATEMGAAHPDGDAAEDD